MWKLSEIRIRNIVSFHEATLQFTQGVATLIFGKNCDNAAQPCNGSGKSSLVEAIAFALTGEPLRKVTTDEIINDTEDEASIILKLANPYREEVMTIERHLSRKAPQTVRITKQTGPYDTNLEEIQQPTVADYNKYILDEIGLSKDDIYNNYILCDNKYESFFDCPDKSKKAIINRFSNGAIVDESILRLQKDMEPVQAQLNNANNDVIHIKGSISAIEFELGQADEKAANAKQERASRIERLDGQIQKCREDVESANARCDKAEERLEMLSRIKGDVFRIENSRASLIDAYCEIKALCEANELGQISNYEALSDSYKNSITSDKSQIEAIGANLVMANKAYEEARNKFEDAKEEYQRDCEIASRAEQDEKAAKNKLGAELSDIESQLDEIEKQIRDNKVRQSELAGLIANNEALLKGAITCPKCEHTFFPGNSKTVEAVTALVEDYTDELSKRKNQTQALLLDFDKIDAQGNSKDADIRSIEKASRARALELDQKNRALRQVELSVEEARHNIEALQQKSASFEIDVERLTGKIEVLRERLFGEINNLLDGRIENGKGFLQAQSAYIETAKGQMAAYQQAKRELLEAPETDFKASLLESLSKYREQLAKALEVAQAYQNEYNVLKEQEVNFTMFKSHLARKKIDALSLIVNDFLEKIGSDIRLRLEGYTVTKTGKLRDKISIQVMRDGIDCGSYHKFSGGEKARLNLACILSLHTLTNSNCEDGKGLDFIIIDELLDKSDEVGMSTYCEALNKLGQTSLLITQGAVSEAYPHQLLIVKEHGISSIDN